MAGVGVCQLGGQRGELLDAFPFEERYLLAHARQALLHRGQCSQHVSVPRSAIAQLGGFLFEALRAGEGARQFGTHAVPPQRPSEESDDGSQEQSENEEEIHVSNGVMDR